MMGGSAKMHAFPRAHFAHRLTQLKISDAYPTTIHPRYIDTMKKIKIFSIFIFAGGIILGIYAAYSTTNRYGLAAGILTSLIPLVLLSPFQAVRRRINAQISRRILAEGLEDPETLLERARVLSQINAKDLYKPYVTLELCWQAAASFTCGVAIVVSMIGLIALQRSAT
jgi:hypothetical protein